MIQRFGPTLLATTVAAVLIFALPTGAQNSVTSRPGHLITQEINDNNMVTLHGNVRSQGERRQRSRSRSRRPAHGPPAAAIAAAPEQKAALEKLIEEMHTPGSPNFHQWLTAAQSTSRYGLSQEDVAKISGWLVAQGLHVNVAYPAMRFFR